MENTFVNLTLFLYLLTGFIFLLSNFMKVGTLVRLAKVSGIVGILANASAITARWQVTHYPPFSNMYESMVFFAFAIAIIYLIISSIYSVNLLGAPSFFLALLTLGLAKLLRSDVTPLMPALRSPWLTIHVVTCFVGYAAFGLSYLSAVTYLLKKEGTERGVSLYITCFTLSWVVTLLLIYRFGMMDKYLGSIGNVILFTLANLLLGGVVWFPLHLLFSNSKVLAILPGEDALDEYVYLTIGFGFPFLTAGIITGAVWANRAWSSYWQWDPKETWSLITWIVYAIYLHVRFVGKWRKSKSAWASLIGFSAVLFTFFGVNYLLSKVLSSLHSY